VAVLAIFKEMDADITLYTLIFGESIFNDAISIVLYDTVVSATDFQTMSYKKEISHSMAEFCIVLVGSVMIGALSALLIAFILKR
jgi:NhaP-type Na+/H+ or K+/H+ antiporter